MYVEKEQKKDEVQGVRSEDYTYKDIKVSHIEISKEGEKKLNKKSGSYITIFADGVKKQDTQKQAYATEVLAKEIENLMKKNNLRKDDKGLIVGLGNWNVTPDALGDRKSVGVGKECRSGWSP